MWSGVYFFSCIFVCALGGFIQIQNGITPRKDSKNGISGRIVNGSPALLNEFPWQVTVKSRVGQSSALCGGSLISNEWILTAAHCAQGFQSFNIGLGSNELYFPTVTRQAIYAVVHFNYSNFNLNNDLALIKISPVAINERIKPIRLPTLKQASQSFRNNITKVSGFGLTNSGSVSQQLQQTSIRIISNNECAKVYSSEVVIASTICGLGLEWPNQSTCNGDSGGPLVLKENDGYTQIGVVSFVSSAGCSSGNPSGYVRTASFLSWINQITGIEIHN